ncbi:hypothetical protein [Streptomyces syringium]
MRTASIAPPRRDDAAFQRAQGTTDARVVIDLITGQSSSSQASTTH